MAKSSVFVTSLALIHLKESFDWYESQQTSLGEKFRFEVRECIDRLTTKTVDYQAYYESIRKVELKRFPYHLYYKREPERIVILGLFHIKRNPDEIKRLLKQ